jgi:peroxiredoxin Q/BCP
MSVTIGCKAPDFSLISDQGKNWHLSDQDGNVKVLLFYPQNETLVCNRQLCSLRDNWHEYLETKATIVGISPAKPDDHRALSKQLNLPIKLLADPERRVTKLYAKHWLYPINFTRAVVIIDANGIIRNVDIMLRIFRPKDSQLITDIYAARGDKLNETYHALRTKISDLTAK